MNRRGRDSDDDDFAGALDDVKPLAGRSVLLPPRSPKRPTKTRAASTSVTFVVGRDGERSEGRAPGTNRKTLKQLRQGEFPAERELDLHGFTAAIAQRQLISTLRDAHERGLRCVRVIHGRGAHSEGDAVLRDAVPEWLQQDPLAGLVIAFAGAPASQGGSGATLVLLRRARE
jgi:DNA-nicking Smr family endonuclease